MVQNYIKIVSILFWIGNGSSTCSPNDFQVSHAHWALLSQKMCICVGAYWEGLALELYLTSQERRRFQQNIQRPYCPSIRKCQISSVIEDLCRQVQTAEAMTQQFWIKLLLKSRIGIFSANESCIQSKAISFYKISCLIIHIQHSGDIAISGRKSNFAVFVSTEKCVQDPRS